MKNIIETFVSELQALIQNRLDVDYPASKCFAKVGVEFSEKYAKVWVSTKFGSEYKTGDTRSLVCFIALEDSVTKTQGTIVSGDILKGSWKAPASKGKRGNILDWKQVFDSRGQLKYLR